MTRLGSVGSMGGAIDNFGVCTRKPPHLYAKHTLQMQYGFTLALVWISPPTLQRVNSAVKICNRSETEKTMLWIRESTECH